MTVAICRECGARVPLRSSFEAECPECGSEDLEAEDAYDPVERELQCEFCGHTVDTATGPDRDWADEGDATPTSVDDPCPICGRALVPRSEARSPRDLPEHKLARAAARKLHREHAIPGPPYALEQLAADLGLEVKVGAFSHDGMLVGTTIEIPASAAPVVRRFAMAHEIGHYVLRHEGERAKAEPEANALATELLVPREQLLSEVARTPTVPALCAMFCVSRQAMVYALMAAKAIGRVRS
jgi:predicted RNA-binding Zn-ribbon protein involved in translation (DUF1610 family)